MLEQVGLEVIYAVHLRLTGKAIVEFILAIIGLFTRCYGLGGTSKYRLEDAVFEGVACFGPKFQVEEDISQQPFFMSLN